MFNSLDIAKNFASCKMMAKLYVELFSTIFYIKKWDYIKNTLIFPHGQPMINYQTSEEQYLQVFIKWPDIFK